MVPLSLCSLTPIALSLCSCSNPKTELGRDVKSPPHGSSPRALVGRSSSALSLSLATRKESRWEPFLLHRRPVPFLRSRRPPAPIPASTGRPRPRRRLHRSQGEHCSLPDIIPPPLASGIIGCATAVLRRRSSSPPACVGSPRVAQPCLRGSPCRAVAVSANEKLRRARFRRRRRGDGRRPSPLRQLDVTRAPCLADLRVPPASLTTAPRAVTALLGRPAGFWPVCCVCSFFLFNLLKSHRILLQAFDPKTQPKM